MGRDPRVADPWNAGADEAVEAARRARVPKDQAGARHAWRDRGLVALRAHIAQADDEIGT